MVNRPIEMSKFTVYSVPVIKRKRIRVLVCHDKEPFIPSVIVENHLPPNVEIDSDDKFGIECNASYKTKGEAFKDKVYGCPNMVCYTKTDLK